MYELELDMKYRQGKVSPLEGIVRAPRTACSIYRDDLSRLSVRQVLNALLCFEGKLHPETLVLGVDEAVGVAPEPRHMAERLGNATVGHDNGDLVQRLRKIRREGPVAVRAPHARPRITFDRVVEIRELERIAQEEDRGVVTHKVPVALVCVELQRESADVSLGVRGTAFTGHGRKARKHLRLLPDLGEDLRLGVLGDVMGNSEGAESSRALGMHTALWNHLAVEVRHLLKKPDVLEQRRTPFASCCNVLIVVDGGAECCRKFLIHIVLSLVLRLFVCHLSRSFVLSVCRIRNGEVNMTVLTAAISRQL